MDILETLLKWKIIWMSTLISSLQMRMNGKTRYISGYLSTEYICSFFKNCLRINRLIEELRFRLTVTCMWLFNSDDEDFFFLTTKKYKMILSIFLCLTLYYDFLVFFSLFEKLVLQKFLLTAEFE